MHGSIGQLYVIDAVPGARLTVSGAGSGNQAMWRFGTIPGSFRVTVVHDLLHPSAFVLPVVKSPKVTVAAGDAPCAQSWSQPCR